MTTRSTTKKELADLLAKAQEALGLASKDEVFQAIGPLSGAVNEYLSERGGKITPYSNGDWLIVWLEKDASVQSLRINPADFTLDPVTFVKKNLAARGIEPDQPGYTITTTTAERIGFAAQSAATPLIDSLNQACAQPATNPFTGKTLDNQVVHAAFQIVSADFLRLTLLGLQQNNPITSATIHSLAESCTTLATHAVTWDRPQVDATLARQAIQDLTGFHATQPSSLSDKIISEVMGGTTLLTDRWPAIVENLATIGRTMEADPDLPMDNISRLLERIAGSSDDNDLAVACTQHGNDLIGRYMEEGKHGDLIYALYKANWEVMGGTADMGKDEYLEHEHKRRQPLSDEEAAHIRERLRVR